MKWWPFYRQIMDEPLSMAYSADTLYDLGIKRKVLGELDTDEKIEEAELAHKAIRRWFQNNLKDVKPDHQVRYNNNYQDAWFAWRILLLCRRNLFTEAQWEALQTPATREIVLNALPQLEPKPEPRTQPNDTKTHAQSNTNMSPGANQVPRRRISSPLITGLLVLMGILAGALGRDAVTPRPPADLTSQGRDQPIAVMVCPERDDTSKTLNVMLTHLLDATAGFRTVSPAAVRGNLGSLEPYLCDDDDTANLDQVCAQIGADFLLWGTPAQADAEHTWSGRLYQRERGFQRFQARASHTQALAAAIVNGCLQLVHSQARVETAAVFSNSDWANHFFAEAERQRTLGHTQTAYHLYTTCLEQDHLFHLAKIRRAECAWEMGDWQEAVTGLETLIQDFETVLSKDLLIKATMLQARLYFAEMDPRFETAVKRTKDLINNPDAYETLYLLQQEIRYREFRGDMRDAGLLRAAMAKAPINPTDPRARVLDLMFQAKARQREGDYPAALPLLTQAADLAQTHALTEQYFSIMSETLDIRILRLKTSEEVNLAMSQLEAAEMEARAIGNTAWLMMLTYYRGHALLALNQTTEGREALEIVADQCSRQGLGLWEVRAKFKLADLANRAGQTTKARYYLQALIDRFEALPLDQKMWVTRQSAFTAYQNGDYLRVLEYSDQILEYAHALALPKEIARELSNKGEALLLLGRYQEAEVALLDAFQRREKLKDPAVIQTIRHLVTLYDRKQNPEELARFKSLLP